MDFNLRFRTDLHGYNTRNTDKVVYTNHAVASAELQAAFQICPSKYITPLQNSDKKPDQLSQILLMYICPGSLSLTALLCQGIVDDPALVCDQFVL